MAKTTVESYININLEFTVKFIKGLSEIILVKSLSNVTVLKVLYSRLIQVKLKSTTLVVDILLIITKKEFNQYLKNRNIGYSEMLTMEVNWTNA